MKQSTKDVRDMIARLTAFRVTYWGEGSENGMLSGKDREQADLPDAHVTSSLVKGKGLLERVQGAGCHKVVIDIDHPAFLVESSTPGHHHLYVDLPDVPHDDYMDWLRASARIGLIEPGYAAVSLERGHSDVRLPWVRKGEEAGRRPALFCFNCHKPGHEFDEYRMIVAAEAETTMAAVTDEQVLDYIWHNEGTLNRRTGQFACTECYIRIGQPSSPRGWTVPDEVGL